MLLTSATSSPLFHAPDSPEDFGEEAKTDAKVVKTADKTLPTAIPGSIPLVPPSSRRLRQVAEAPKQKDAVVQIETDADGEIVGEQPVSLPRRVAQRVAKTAEGVVTAARDKVTEVQDRLEQGSPGAVTPPRAVATSAVGACAAAAGGAALGTIAGVHNVARLTEVVAELGVVGSYGGGALGVVTGGVSAGMAVADAVAARSSERRAYHGVQAALGGAKVAQSGMDMATAGVKAAAGAAAGTSATVLGVTAGAAGVGGIVGCVMIGIGAKDLYDTKRRMEELERIFKLIPQDPETAGDDYSVFAEGLQTWLHQALALSEEEQGLSPEDQEKILKNKREAFKEVFGKDITDDALKYLHEVQETPLRALSEEQADERMTEGTVLLAKMMVKEYRARVQAIRQVVSGCAMTAASAAAVVSHGIAPAVVGVAIGVYTAANLVWDLDGIIAEKASSDEPWSDKKRGALLAQITKLQREMVRFSEVEVLLPGSVGYSPLVLEDFDDEVA